MTVVGRSETVGPLSGTLATQGIAVDGVEIRLAGPLNGSFGQEPPFTCIHGKARCRTFPDIT